MCYGRSWFFVYLKHLKQNLLFHINLDNMSAFLGCGEEVLCHTHIWCNCNMLYYITIGDYCCINVYDTLQYTSVYSKPQTFSFLIYCNILSKNVFPLQLLDQKFSKPKHIQSFHMFLGFSTCWRLMVLASNLRNNILHLLINLCFSYCNQQHEWTCLTAESFLRIYVRTSCYFRI